MNIKRKKLYKHLNDFEMVQKIVENGGIQRVDRKTKQNALFFALEKEISIETLTYLLDNNIQMNLQNKEGNSVIHLCDDLEKLDVILRYHPDLNLRNKKSHTPIFKCNVHEKANLLVKAGIDLNVVDGNGQHFLKTLNSMDFDLMKIFIDKGMNRFIEKRGMTLDSFFETWSSIETQAYYENKLKTNPEKYKIKV